MSNRDISVRSMPLRAPDGFSISEGMPERKSGVEQAIAALLSWLSRPRRPPDVPAHLRDDLGLPPLAERPCWQRGVIPPYLPDPVKFDRW